MCGSGRRHVARKGRAGKRLAEERDRDRVLAGRWRFEAHRVGAVAVVGNLRPHACALRIAADGDEEGVAAGGLAAGYIVSVDHEHRVLAEAGLDQPVAVAFAEPSDCRRTAAIELCELVWRWAAAAWRWACRRRRDYWRRLPCR